MMKTEFDPADIEAALSRVSAGETFRNAPQLVNFLSFVISRTLAGQEQAIKGYTIATEALGRPDDFDPQTDPIVRVEAGRLRRALDIYYMGQGKADPIRIVIPRGTYVPRFEATGAPAVGTEPNGPDAPVLDPQPPSDAASGVPLLAPRAMFASRCIGVPHRIAAALVVASAILVILFALHRNETGWLARVVRAPLMHPSAAIPERPGARTRAVTAERSPAA
jgi:hypothetical protein